jgi:NADH dehydrogenase [ubiquinone] 1 alpha subcomplex assembly factor 1
VPQETRISMGTQIRNVGIALLGGHSDSTGKYELGIDSIGIANEEDIHTLSSEQCPFSLNSV